MCSQHIQPSAAIIITIIIVVVIGAAANAPHNRNHHHHHHHDRNSSSRSNAVGLGAHTSPLTSPHLTPLRLERSPVCERARPASVRSAIVSASVCVCVHDTVVQSHTHSLYDVSFIVYCFVCGGTYINLQLGDIGIYSVGSAYTCMHANGQKAGYWVIIALRLLHVIASCPSLRNPARI